MAIRSFGLVIVFGLFLGCNAEKPDESYIARVGSDYLHESDVVAAFDSSLYQNLPGANGNGRTQFIDRWVASALLANEAERRGISTRPEIQRLIRDNERSILANALVDEVFDESLEAANESAIIEYYNANLDRLLIREPFVEVRYLAADTREKAEEARRLLQRALRGAGVDSLWQKVVVDFAEDQEASLFLSSNHFPQSRLFGASPTVRDRLVQLGSGQLAPVIEADDRYHVLQLVDRQPAGTVPELDWIHADLARQLEQQTQKDTYARLVQRLRNEANSRNAVEIK